MISEGMQNVINMLKQFQESMQEERSVKASRDRLEQIAASEPLPDDVKCEQVDAGGIPAEWIFTPEVTESNVIIYLHGGGWIAGSLNSHRNHVARISRASNIRVLNIEYSLAPEHPFPAGLNDCVIAYKWVLSLGIKPDKVIIAGDSAGGNLTLASLIKLRDEGTPLPIAAVCLSPLTDGTLSGESYKTRANFDPVLTPEGVEFMISQYVEKKERKNPLVSPLFADLHGLPPILVHVGTAEILYDDSIRFAERAEEAGVDVTLEVFEDLIHVFHVFGGLAPEGQEGANKVGKFVKKYMS
jgi:monoterpene epsilon-lactone hydrolase